MSTPIDIFSTPMVPMLDAAWIRDNLFDPASRAVASDLHKLAHLEREMEALRAAREAVQESLLRNLTTVRAQREEDENG